MEAKNIIYELRTKKGLSQEELAEKVSAKILAGIEKNLGITIRA